MAGLSCAQALVRHGHEVALFDKGRGPGGRMSTRRADVGGTTVQFDHGAPWFSARDPSFVAQVEQWEAAGLAARYPEGGADVWVGTSAMNAPVAALAAAHRVAWSTRVEALEQSDCGWRLVGAAHDESFDASIVAIPTKQAATLLQPHQRTFAEQAARSTSVPCWTAMIAFAEPVRTDHAVIRNADPIALAIHDGAKPGRDGAATWVVHATSEWSQEHLELSREEVAPMLLHLFEQAVGMPLPPLLHLAAHRWRYARGAIDNAPEALWDAELKLGVCGDWLLGPEVEAAWLSGKRLAGAIG